MLSVECGRPCVGRDVKESQASCWIYEQVPNMPMAAMNIYINTVFVPLNSSSDHQANNLCTTVQHTQENRLDLTLS